MTDQQTMLPTQPIIIDGRGHITFRPNKIVQWLFKRDAINVHKIFTDLNFPAEDRMQLLQLLGLPLNEYSTNPFVTPENVAMITHAIGEFVSADVRGEDGDDDAGED